MCGAGLRRAKETVRLLTTLDQLPSLGELSGELNRLCERSDAARRALRAVREGVFEDAEGNRDELGEVRLAPVQVALLAHLASQAPGDHTIDIGFGMGTSATIIMAAREARGGAFQHFAFDPYGLPNGRGRTVQSYLQRTFESKFQRVMMPSEVGLGQLLQQGGRERSSLIVIDGDHRFDQVITDFFLSDQLCAQGGYIFFDDAFYPAVESAVSFIAANRPDYEVVHLPVWNTSLARKVSRIKPAWDSFDPFAVAQRHGWDAVANELPEELP